MFQRPKPGETDEDLLRQQEQFLKASGKQSISKRKIQGNEEINSKRVEVWGDVVEKNAAFFVSKIESKFEQSEGFPKAFVIDPLLTRQENGKKKSLFAMQMEKNRKKVESKMEVDETVKMSSVSSQSDLDRLLPGPSGSERSIHEENLGKLSKMSEEEILEERKKLLETLDPNLVSFLRKRGEEKTALLKNEDVEKSKSMEFEKCLDEEEEVKRNLEKYIDSKWINIDFFEKEKLEWVGDIPEKKSLEPGEPYSARFDFEGELQPFSTEIDVRSSLYHHGDEPDRPGYTIQELYQLSRSKVLQQRILSLNTLANIIRKTKLGYYDKCFDGQLLHKLVESDLFFLLRFSIDENYLVPASVNCLHSLVCNESDEFCLDKLLGSTNLDEQPLLYNKMEAGKDEEKELKDNVVIGCDLVKGVLRTDLLIRLAYVLSNFSPTRETVIRIINCLIRISRHSSEATVKILRTTNLLKLVYTNIRARTPVYEGVKLFRIMVAQSQEIAAEVIQNYDLRFLVSFIEAEENVNISKKEFYLLKLETIYLWRSLLFHNLFVDEFVQWSPCLIRLLFFYAEKVDVNTGNDFDFELFSAITSLIVTCNRKKIAQDSNVVALMRICLEKWLVQLMQYHQYNFAVAKAIGCIFRYFTSSFKSFGVVAMDMEFMKKINSMLVSLFRSGIFEEMSSALQKYSYVLQPKKVSRDPDNLPSLCSVYGGGDGFLKIVQNDSSLLFFMSLVKYLKAVYRISHDSKSIIKSFFECAKIREYISKVCKCDLKIYNWFMKYETTFLADSLSLLSLLEDQDTLIVSFRLLPLLRVDDKKSKKVLGVIFDRNNWKLDLDYLDHLYSLYSEMLLQNRDQIEVVNYKNELIPEEWVYKILTLLRGKETVGEVINVLKFICFILSKNPVFIERISPTFRYYYSCSVFLTDSNVFDAEIQSLLETLFNDIAVSRERVNFDVKCDKNKSFYDLYTELIIQYAGLSYGLPVFAQFVLFPLQNCYNVSFRKLLWFEYLHVLRVITLPFPTENFIDLKAFIEPCETDESLLVAYINSVSSKVILKTRNPFVYKIAVGNLNNFLTSKNRDEKLLTFLQRKIDCLKSEELKNDILNFTLIN